MIIDWDVNWPHAGKVTADTAANHTVSRQRRREWRSEGGHVNMAFMSKSVSTKIKISQLTTVQHRPSLNIHVPRLVGPLEELPYKPCRPFWASWVEPIGKVPQERCEVRREGDKKREARIWIPATKPLHTIISNPTHTLLSQSDY